MNEAKATHQDVRLRAIEPEDLDLLYKIENDTDIWNVGATNVPYSRYALHDYVANTSRDIYTDRQVRLMIENSSRNIVGIVDVVNFEPCHNRAEVGIVILEQYRKKGYARAALLEMIKYSQKVIHIHQLYAVINQTNDASVRLFANAGFHETSRLLQWLYDGREYHDAVVMQLFL